MFFQDHFKTAVMIVGGICKLKTTRLQGEMLYKKIKQLAAFSFKIYTTVSVSM